MIYNMLNVLDDINHFFDDPFADFKDAGTIGYTVPAFPPTDIRINKNGEMELKFALAGYSKEELSLDYKDNKLILSTSEKYNKDANKVGENEKLIASNFKHSSFSYSYFLPEVKFNIAELKADFKDGVLCILVPPKEKKEDKKVNLYIN